jgi:uncharacterized protein YeaO (DUF488 family)
MVMIQIKRAYEPPSRTDGTRVLVERLWPRGLTKKKVAVTLWLKEIAPSPELRKWFGHDPAKWKEFERKYRRELKTKGDVVHVLRHLAETVDVTLIYAAHDQNHNGALVLKNFLEQGVAK